MRFQVSLIVLIVAAFLLSSCGNETRMQKTLEWIHNHPKPIRVFYHSVNGWTMNRRYTLIDSLGNIYYAGEISATLPDTINAYTR